jgi:hypothetical protein
MKMRDEQSSNGKTWHRSLVAALIAFSVAISLSVASPVRPAQADVGWSPLTDQPIGPFNKDDSLVPPYRMAVAQNADRAARLLNDNGTAQLSLWNGFRWSEFSAIGSPSSSWANWEVAIAEDGTEVYAYCQSCRQFFVVKPDGSTTMVPNFNEFDFATAQLVPPRGGQPFTAVYSSTDKCGPYRSNSVSELRIRTLGPTGWSAEETVASLPCTWEQSADDPNTAYLEVHTVKTVRTQTGDVLVVLRRARPSQALPTKIGVWSGNTWSGWKDWARPSHTWGLVAPANQAFVMWLEEEDPLRYSVRAIGHDGWIGQSLTGEEQPFLCGRGDLTVGVWDKAGQEVARSQWSLSGWTAPTTVAINGPEPRTELHAARCAIGDLDTEIVSWVRTRRAELSGFITPYWYQSQVTAAARFGQDWTHPTPLSPLAFIDENGPRPARTFSLWVSPSGAAARADIGWATEYADRHFGTTTWRRGSWTSAYPFGDFVTDPYGEDSEDTTDGPPVRKKLTQLRVKIVRKGRRNVVFAKVRPARGRVVQLIKACKAPCKPKRKKFRTAKKKTSTVKMRVPRSWNRKRIVLKVPETDTATGVRMPLRMPR